MINIPSKSKPIRKAFKMGLQKVMNEVNPNGFMEIIVKLSVRLAARAKLNSMGPEKPFPDTNKITATIVAV